MAMMAGVGSHPWTMHQTRVKPAHVALASISPEDVHGFLRALAVNPLGDTTSNRATKQALAEYRARHTELVLGAHIAMRGGKRKRSDVADDDDTLSSEGERQRRARRSTRPKTRSGLDDGDFDLENGKSRGAAPKIGNAFQVDVPRAMVPPGQRTPEMTRISSELVYSPEMCNGHDNVLRFLRRLHDTLEQRDGFGYSPNGEEVGLCMLAKHAGDVDAAMEDTCKQVKVGREFAGVGPTWTYNEKCLFVRGLAEREKDFHFIAKKILKRPTSQCVQMYYTYQKQQVMMHGGSAEGHIFDTGDEPTEFLPRLGPARVSAALSCLAKTAGDGFPADRRMADAIKSVRDNAEMDQTRKRPRSTRSGRNFAAPPS